MNLNLLKKYKWPLLILLLLALVFGNRSTCNGVTGYGFCSSNNGKVTHYSPLNYLS